VGIELLQAEGRKDGRTDMRKLIVVFRSFANAHNNCTPNWNCIYVYYI